MTANIPIRPDTKKRLEDVRIQLINQLKTSKITWDKTINTLIEHWNQSKASIKTQKRRGRPPKATR